MDVGGWLRKLGLEQYEAAFRENKIDDTVLPSLTVEDLKDLGVGFVGDRRKLLDAIAALRTETSAPTPLSGGSTVIGTTAKDTAERRQVTVMFSDLVGSTALSTRLDPEDLREVISAYQRCVAETVRRFGGFVARYLGDGVLIYFGYPAAHEDDAERAVRAGLALIDAVATLPTPEPLEVRIGAATGLVVVGDIVGSGEAQEHDIVGETPNLAARLQAIAGPNTVVIAEATRRLLGNLFELRDLGPRELKGFAGPVRAFAVPRVSSVESRFEAMHPGGLTELVGREGELELLLRRWARAKTGEGQVVLISGEAGIGKSRLAAALMEALTTEPHTRLRYFGSPQHTDSAFYPLIGQFERAARFAHGDTPQTKLDKLDALLAQTSTSRQDAGLLAEMLSLPNDGRYPALEPVAEQRRQKTLVALGVQLESLAHSGPVLSISEDAHWSDPTSLEAFGRSVDLIARLPVLMIMTFRPEFEAPWVGQPHVTALALNRLGHCEVGTMIDHVIGNRPLPEHIRKDIIERTDGIPLFVEEMTKAVLEAGGELEAIRTAAAVPSPALPVPASLHASLMARLDRLGPAKELAQIGAALGRQFSHALLASLARQTGTQLQFALDRLVQAGLVFRQGVPPNATYLFKHALVQDIAYGTLLRDQRRALHARIVEHLERDFPDVAESQPELVAHHCTEAGLSEKAARLWGQAGQRSFSRSALLEAAKQFNRALTQIAALPRTPDLRREQIKLQVLLVGALMHTSGYAAPETKTALDRARSLFEEAEEIGEPPEDPLLLFSVLYGFWAAQSMAFDGEIVRDLAAEFLTLAQKQRAAVQMTGHRMMGVAQLYRGELADAMVHFNQAMDLHSPAGRDELATWFGSEPGVATLAFRANVLRFLGYSDAALLDVEQAIKQAREIRHAATLMHTLTLTSFVLIPCGKYVSAKMLSDELISLGDQKGALVWKAFGMILQGWLLSIEKAPGAVKLIASGINAYRSTSARLNLPYLLSLLAKAEADICEFDRAWQCINEAFATAKSTNERLYDAEILRTAGEIALMSPELDLTKGEAYFGRALAIARQQNAKSLELRAAVSMARLWRDQGKRDEARELLAPVYGWFTEGFDTLDLKQAKALLDELAP
jgi:class 3 adenylate cyclase/predicted ATPase